MARVQNLSLYILTALVFILIGWFGNTAWNLIKSSKAIIKIVPKPLEKYSIESLSSAKVTPVSFEIGGMVKEDPKFTSHEFSLSFDPTLQGGPRKKVSGLINTPKGKGPFPLVVMFRGYVDQKKYSAGQGTGRLAEFLAKNGFITIALDFLGYAGSDPEAQDIFESRFQTYTTAITIIKSLDHSVSQPFNYSNVFIWGHSNGGQIALTALEISGANYPTVLWAPVSKPFPFSILYYTDESDDHGKLIRNELSSFEQKYDVEKYSLTNYFDKIKAPIQLNQGTADDAVPPVWSEMLAKKLKEASISASLIRYSGADHNMMPGWQNAAENVLAFFRSFLVVQ